VRLSEISRTQKRVHTSKGCCNEMEAKERPHMYEDSCGV
jgi:hypothetical protein